MRWNSLLGDVYRNMWSNEAGRRCKHRIVFITSPQALKPNTSVLNIPFQICGVSKDCAILYRLWYIGTVLSHEMNLSSYDIDDV